MNLFSLAFKNIKKSIKDYSIYFITLLIAVSLFYIFNAIDSQTAMMNLSKSKQEMIEALVSILGYLSIFVAFILGFLIVYANNFIIKRRKKEIGLYLTLGMSRTRVSMILVVETIFIGVASLAIGLLLGIGLSQLVSVFTAYMFEVDLTSFTFSFSTGSLIKTIICFGVIFVIVMLFNFITLSRFKLIDLLRAKSVNESIKLKNKYLTMVTFALSIGLIGYAYYLLNHNALMGMNNDFAIMIVCGAIGTFLLFYSLSAFLLKVIQRKKNIYYKGLNIFVLKQVNSSINSHVVSMTVISLMLLLTIGILSTSLSLTNSMNETINNQYPADYTITMSHDNPNYNEIKNDKKYQDLVSKDYQYNLYYNEQVTIKSLLLPEDLESIQTNVLYDATLPVMLESDYNALSSLYGDNETININENQYVPVCTFKMAQGYYDRFLSHDGTLTINNHQLKSTKKKCISNNITSRGYEDGLIVIDDSYRESLEVSNYNIVGLFNSRISEDQGQEFSDYIINQYNGNCNTKVIMMSQTNSSTAMITFIGLYLGIIFAISSGTVLAIEQLSQASDNIERYGILRQLGADRKMINRSLMIQIGLSFMFPLIIALIHSYVGVSEVTSMIQLIIQVDLTQSIFTTTLFIVLVYGGYYLATYIASNRIINEKE